MAKEKAAKPKARPKAQEIDKAILPEDEVRLKPILGLRPGVYLFGFYCFLFVLLLFFVLVCPGLVQSGNYLSCNSEPAGAAVRIDDVYRGTTPCEFFVAKGEHSIEFVLPGFNTEALPVVVEPVVFASVFRPKKLAVEASLKTDDPVGVFTLAAKEYAQWSQAGEPTAAWHVPMVLSEGAARLVPWATEPSVRAALNDVLEEALLYAASNYALQDAVQAKALLDNGFAPTSLGIMQSLAGFVDMLPEEEQFDASGWVAGGTRIVGDLEFINIRNTNSSIEDFWICTTELGPMNWNDAAEWCKQHNAAIPSERQWQAAAAAMDLQGNFWEWCSDGYAPYGTSDLGPDKVLRGGSTDINARGALPPDTGSDFVGLRPVLTTNDTNKHE
ncbi:MAG: PEGA domain-containing protein [Spirochaetaceae bacterium]|jgi:hypothetical protein|nr:PEGA domain-containing protein [Spirochaetaceae bacterium]